MPVAHGAGKLTDQLFILMDLPPDRKRTERKPMHHPQRLHSLDNLRAIMMWLGIVLHAAVNHLDGHTLLPWRDSATSPFADLIVVFIHTFRMPVFFIIGGFFAALLISRAGHAGMLKHRLRRIGLPFIVFWPFVFIGASVLAMLYVHLMVKGTLGVDPALMPPDPLRPIINTWHMWFLYYLLWFCVLTALAGPASRHLPAGFMDRLSSSWAALAMRWWGCLVLALPLALVGAGYEQGIIRPSGSFIPELSELVHNGMFFALGLAVYWHREAVLRHHARYCWRYALGGLVFFILVGGIADHFRQAGSDPVAVRVTIAFLYNCASWLWSFALIGLFVRYLRQPSAVLHYVAESSYWVYLVHMFGTIGFGILLFDLPLPALVKLALNIVLTSIACIGTYHFLVRNTWVGVLLNGARATSPHVVAEEARPAAQQLP